MSSPNPQNEFDHSSLGFMSIVSLMLAMALGIFGAMILAPSWIPNFAQTLVGADPKAYWYLSRASAFAALGLLWLSMMLGLLITNKVSRYWPGAAAAFAIHEYVSLLGMAFALFHALVLMGDHYINYTLAQVLMPFGSVNYHPFWVGIGQLGFYRVGHRVPHFLYPQYHHFQGLAFDPLRQLPHVPHGHPSRRHEWHRHLDALGAGRVLVAGRQLFIPDLAAYGGACRLEIRQACLASRPARPASSLSS
jgi:hypothetical protein